MLTAALLELLPQPDEFVKRLNGLGIPGVTYRLEQAEKCGITGLPSHRGGERGNGA